MSTYPNLRNNIYLKKYILLYYMETLEELSHNIDNLDSITDFNKKIEIIKSLRKQLLDHQKNLQIMKNQLTEINYDNIEETNLTFQDLKNNFKNEKLEDKIKTFKLFSYKVHQLEKELFKF